MPPADSAEDAFPKATYSALLQNMHKDVLTFVMSAGACAPQVILTPRWVTADIDYNCRSLCPCQWR